MLFAYPCRTLCGIRTAGFEYSCVGSNRAREICLWKVFIVLPLIVMTNLAAHFVLWVRSSETPGSRQKLLRVADVKQVVSDSILGGCSDLNAQASGLQDLQFLI